MRLIFSSSGMHLTSENLLLFCVCLLFFPNKIYSTFEIIDPVWGKVDSFEEIEAGGIGYNHDMEGFIVSADPPDACTTFHEPSFMTNFTLTKFVLINGSDLCAYKSKVMNAEKAGFDFAVIFVDPNSSCIQNLAFDFNITAAIISPEDGFKIKNYYLYNTSSLYNDRLRRVVDNGPNIGYIFNHLLTCIGVVALGLLCLKILCHLKDLPGLCVDATRACVHRMIYRMRTIKFENGDKYDTCTICLEDYNKGQKLRMLPCSHVFHGKCIKRWLLNNRKTCPLCNGVVFYESKDENDSDDSGISSSENTAMLASSPSSCGKNWGTFPNQDQNQIDLDRPSATTNNSQYADITLVQSTSTTDTENPYVFDNEAENPLHVSHASVNNNNEFANASYQVV